MIRLIFSDLFNLADTDPHTEDGLSLGNSLIHSNLKHLVNLKVVRQ
jgi:hypothetical protein